MKKQEYKEAKDWHKLARQYASGMQELLDQTVVRHLSDAGEMLDSVNTDNYPQPKIMQSVSFLTNINWVLYCNYCMGDYQELIESFVSDVVNLTVRLQRTEKWFCYAVSDVACQLNVNAELRALIKANFEIYKGNYYQTSGKVKREGSFPWAWTIWAILICIRIFSYCDRNDKHESSFNSSEFMKGVIENQNEQMRSLRESKYLDSILRSSNIDQKRIDSIIKANHLTPIEDSPATLPKPSMQDTMKRTIKKLNEAIEKVDVSGGGGSP